MKMHRDFPKRVLEYPRVTSIIKQTLAAPELVEWAYRQTVDGVSGAVSIVARENGGFLSLADVEELSDPEQLDNWLASNKLRPADYAMEKAELGTEGHAYLEKLAHVQLEVDAETAYDRALKSSGWVERGPSGHERAIASWWCTRDPIVLSSEVRLWSDTYEFRGTGDLVWKDQDGARVLTDLKNRKGNTPCGVKHKTDKAAAACHETGAYKSDFAQVSAYKIAHEELLRVPIDRRTVLVARDDGTWGEYEVTVDEGVFLKLLEVYRMFKS